MFVFFVSDSKRMLVFTQKRRDVRIDVVGFVIVGDFVCFQNKCLIKLNILIYYK